ncbi:hypothetical protein ANO11243_058410 [Dothideomycetidae sp. 11243]|nr:hypothetical protein ANO11243_058410 [fungal sp. No.11243]
MAKSKPSPAQRRKPTLSVAKKTIDTSSGEEIPEHLQQNVLNIFRDCFFQSRDVQLEPVIQKVKQHLYDRDFATAFGSEQHLEAYAARWSAARALGYLQIFHDVSPFLHYAGRLGPLPGDSRSQGPQSADADELIGRTAGLSVGGPAHQVEDGCAESRDDLEPGPLRTVTFLGGGAGAELVACAAWLRLQCDKEVSGGKPGLDFISAPAQHLAINCVDIADWSKVVRRLDEGVKAAPAISKYASAAAREANVAMLSQDVLRSKFLQQDLLETLSDDLKSLFRSSSLITIMFTLNELYSTSMPKTQRFLSSLTAATAPGTLLLVVDSPGSYSTVRINNSEKKYPMQWLLDHTLLESSKSVGKRLIPVCWEKLLTDDSRWFRLPKELQYPIELENMRYQIHLYRRLDVNDDADEAHASSSGAAV